jgi:hypothetical protein
MENDDKMERGDVLMSHATHQGLAAQLATPRRTFAEDFPTVDSYLGHLRKVRAEGNVPAIVSDMVLGHALQLVNQRTTATLKDVIVLECGIEGGASLRTVVRLVAAVGEVRADVRILLGAEEGAEEIDIARMWVEPWSPAMAALNLPRVFIKEPHASWRSDQRANPPLGGWRAEYQQRPVPAVASPLDVADVRLREHLQDIATIVANELHPGRGADGHRWKLVTRAAACEGCDTDSYQLVCTCGHEQFVPDAVVHQRYIQDEISRRLRRDWSGPSIGTITRETRDRIKRVAERATERATAALARKHVDCVGMMQFPIEHTGVARYVAPAGGGDDAGKAELLAKIARLGEELGRVRAEVAQVRGGLDVAVEALKNTREELSCWKSDPLLQATAAWSRAVVAENEDGISVQRSDAIEAAQKVLVAQLMERGGVPRFRQASAAGELGSALWTAHQDRKRREDEARREFIRLRPVAEGTGERYDSADWSAEVRAELERRAAARGPAVVAEPLDDVDDLL